ncbi:MAG: phytanoyl-CoA dioxygenase family protein [Phycisphaeraceae bacterium]|nr:phytanoyl-CoA dioxygenase family protein [Phycisphaeraceae bacterium]
MSTLPAAIELTPEVVPDDIRQELNQPYRLDRQVVEQFRADGFVHLPRFFSPAALGFFDPLITRITLDRNPHKDKSLDELDTYGRAFIQVGNLWELDPVVRLLALCRRGGQAAAELMGCDGVRMWHDQALYKQAGGGFTPWHADQQYWPFDSGKCVTMWIPLQETPMEMGPLCFGRGSHHKNIGRDMTISDDSEKFIQHEVKRQGIDEVYKPYALGEVSFHYGWTLHRAGPNTTSQPRRVFTIIYMDARMKLAPRTPVHRADWARWTPSTCAGRVLDDPLNPVLYQGSPATEQTS